MPGEISFEPVDEKGKVVGRAISIAVPENGYFQASLPKPDREPQPYRLVVRVAPPVSRDSKSSAINASTFGSNVKTVPLSRELRSGQTLHLAITQ